LPPVERFKYSPKMKLKQTLGLPMDSLIGSQFLGAWLICKERPLNSLLHSLKTSFPLNSMM
jgi:hypothetical protein